MKTSSHSTKPPEGVFNTSTALAVKAPFRGFGGTAILLLMLLIACSTHAQNWQWARSANGISSGSVMCADASGNIYVAGYFEGLTVFGSDSADDTNGAAQDVFVAKYDASGNVLWLRTGNGYGDADGITTDANGNVYVAGNFYDDSISFGGNVLIDPHPGASASNIYFLKYNSSGDLVWAHNLGGVNNDFATGLSADPNGNVLLAGNFTGDSLTFGGVTIQHIGADDGFVAKFDTAGDAQWIRSIGTPVLDGTTAVCTDASGSVFMAGYFNTPYLYIGGPGNLVTSPYSSNVFLIKYDSSGNEKWLRYAGGGGSNSAMATTTDAAGNIHMAGYFSDTLFIGTDTLVGIGIQNIFTAVFDNAGALLWAAPAGGTYVDQPNSISSDATGNSYVTGYYQSDTLFAGSISLANNSGNETFLLRYDANGNALGVLQPGGSSDNTGSGIAYSNGSVFVCGNFSGSETIFGVDTLFTNSLYIGQANMFLAKLDTLISTGIKQVNMPDGEIAVYPNPSTGTFYFSGLTAGDVIQVYDMMGQNVNVSGAMDDTVIDLSSMEKGIYIYRITSNGVAIAEGKLSLQ